MAYKHLPQQRYTDGDYTVRALMAEDMPLIREWRNQQMNVLRQSRPLTEEDQRQYYRNVVVPSFDNPDTRIMLFGYLHREALIGYGGLTNIDWVNRRAEISFLLDTPRSDMAGGPAYADDFTHFLTLMKRIAFEALNLNRLFTETYAIRQFHICILEKNGFQLEGRMRSHVIIDGTFVDSLIHGVLKESCHVQE